MAPKRGSVEFGDVPFAGVKLTLWRKYDTAAVDPKGTRLRRKS
jgi:hypothetical protein